MVDNPSTIILRFRDLVTPLGDTIRNHRSLEEQKGFVWWGWWNKAGERVPPDVFSAIRSIATTAAKRKGGGLDIFLFDSGALRIHPAKLLDIAWETSGEARSSPGRSTTPLYYRQQKYLAWFKLSAIGEPQEAFPDPGYSYLRVDEFFSETPSRFGDFYGKKVFNLEELQQQNRTIWFVRPCIPEDPRHRVSLLSPRKVEPTHFVKTALATTSRTLLWLSDLHFSTGNQHAFPRDKNPTSQPLEQRLIRLLDQCGVQPAAVLATGDLSWAARPEEFEAARACLKELLSQYNLGSDQLAVCPGNHDLAFSRDPSSKNLPISWTGREYREAFEKLYEDLFHLRPNESIVSGRRLLLGTAIPVDIVSLNSSSLQQQKDLFQGHGFVGEPQRDEAEKGMGWTIPAPDVRPLRIVMLHHHLVPVIHCLEPQVGAAYSVVLDANAVSRWLVKHRVRLVLHGHMHQSFFATLTLPDETVQVATGSEREPQRMFKLAIAGLGSTGVAKAHLESEQNEVGLITFERSHLRIAFHSLHPTKPSRLLRSYDVPYEGES